ncbi:MAG: hypothetical protein P4L56_00595 [Candidatus Sulfopaludibacter sp.]|nr:hypothetical protein [Candidatus Sulfopaludibacter sp.]
MPGAKRVAEGQGGRCDKQVRKRNRAAELPCLSVDLCGHLGHLPGKRFNRDASENGIQIFAPPARLLIGLGAVQAVLQFDHGNGREHDFGLSVFVFQCGQQRTYRLGVTLGGDQHPGVQN